MTALCGGATSSIKPGAGPSIIFDAGLITGGLALIDPLLIPFAALIDGFVYEAVSQCPSDPPAFQPMQASDYVALVGGLLNPNSAAVLSKIHSNLLNYAWHQWCQCDAGPQPPPLQPSSSPTGVLVPSSSQSQPCFIGSFAGQPRDVPNLQFASQTQDVTRAMLPTSGSTTTVSDGGGSFTAYGIPAGVSSINNQVHFARMQSCSGPNYPMFFVHFWNSTGTDLGRAQLGLGTLPAGAFDAVQNIPLPGTASFWRAEAQRDDETVCGAMVGDATWSTQVWCGVGPNALASCCPPDPTVTIGIRNILQLLGSLQIGGGGASGYVKSTAHTGLTGEVSLPVTDIIGVLVDVTAGVPAQLVLGGNPPYQWDLGFLSILTVDGMIEQRRLTREHQLWFPAQGEMATVVGVFLNHGVTVNLTELKAA